MRRKLVFLVSLLTFLFIFAPVFFFLNLKSERSNQVLEVKDSASGRVFGSWPLNEAGEFAIEFVHSVHQSPVRESFKIENKMICPLSVRFFSFGAGMQSHPEEGQSMERDGDAIVISGFSTQFRELNYIVGTVSDHLLFINGETLSLRELCGRNAHITIRIK